MGILQTIWTALTTENEMLSTLLLMPETYLESFINVLLFSTLLGITSDKKSKILYIVIISTLCNLVNLFIPNPFRSFINLALMLAFIKIIFKTSIIKTILALILPMVITVLCESIISKFCLCYLNYNIASLVSIPLYRLTITLLVQVLAFIIYLFVKYFKIQISVFENISKKTKFLIVINLIFAILALSIQFFITGFYLNKLPVYIVLFSNLSLVLYFILSLYSLTKTTQLELTSLNLEQEKESNKILKALQDDLHGFRHDFTNIMCTIGGYVQVKDMNGLSKYYSQIQKDINKVNNLGALNPETINNPAIFVLIASKYSKALELGIEMNINIFIDLNKLNMKIYEFTRVLGILLDNAIEAAKECDEKIINIEMRKDTRRNRQLLIIENTFNNKDVDTEQIYQKNYSTKSGNTGLGLWEVRKILNRNDNLNLYTTKNEKFFNQQLEMYNN